MDTYDSSLTATSSSGWVVHANVTPGVVDLVLDHATLTCGHDWGGYQSPVPKAIRFPVLAGVVTTINVTCE